MTISTSIALHLSTERLAQNVFSCLLQYLFLSHVVSFLCVLSYPGSCVFLCVCVSCYLLYLFLCFMLSLAVSFLVFYAISCSIFSWVFFLSLAVSFLVSFSYLLQYLFPILSCILSSFALSCLAFSHIAPSFLLYCILCLVPSCLVLPA